MDTNESTAWLYENPDIETRVDELNVDDEELYKAFMEYDNDCE